MEGATAPLVRRIAVDLLLLAGGFILSIAFLWPSIAGDRAFGPFDMWQGYFPFFFDLPANWREFPRNPLLYDQAFLYSPQQWFIRESLRDGAFPFWNPHFRCGESLIGTGLGSPFSPFNLPVWTMAWPLGYAWSAVLRVGVMWMGAVMLARALGLSRVWQGALGCAFVLLPPFQVFLQQPLSHAYAWLPWCLWVVERTARRAGGGRREVLRAAWPMIPLMVLLFASGHPHSVFNMVFGAGVFGLLRPAWGARSGGLSARGALLAAMLVGGMMSAPMVLPFVAQLRESATLAERAGGKGAQWTLEPRVLRTMTDPHAFGSPFPGAAEPYTGPVNFAEDQQYLGAAPWVFLLLGGAFLRGWFARRRAAILALLAMGALGATLAFGLPPLFKVLAAIPPFSMNSNPRLCLLLHVAVVLCAALVAADWPRHAIAGRRGRAGAAGALLLLASAGAAALAWAPGGSLPLAPPMMAAVTAAVLFAAGWLGFTHPVARAWSCAVLVGLMLADQGRAWIPLHPQPPAEWGDLSRARKLLPPALAADEALRVGAEDFTPPNTPVLWGGTDVRAYSLPASKRYDAYHRAFMKTPNPANLSREDLSRPEVLSGLAMTGARWVLTTNDYPPAMAAYVTPAGRRGPVRIYRLQNASEFASWLPATAVQGAADMQAALAHVTANNQRRPESVVIEGIATATPSPSAPFPLKARRPDANRLEVALPATLPSVPGHVILRESFDRGWRAEDQLGNSLAIRPAQVRFMAVEAPAGTSMIRLRYRPPGWGAGWLLFLVGAGVVGAWVWGLRRLAD